MIGKCSLVWFGSPAGPADPVGFAAPPCDGCALLARTARCPSPEQFVAQSPRLEPNRPMLSKGCQALVVLVPWVGVVARAARGRRDDRADHTRVDGRSVVVDGAAPHTRPHCSGHFRARRHAALDAGRSTGGHRADRSREPPLPHGVAGGNGVDAVRQFPSTCCQAVDGTRTRPGLGDSDARVLHKRRVRCTLGADPPTGSADWCEPRSFEQTRHGCSLVPQIDRRLGHGVTWHPSTGPRRAPGLYRPPTGIT